MGTNAGRQGSKATHTRRATLLQGAAWRLTVPWRALIRGLVFCLVLAGWLARMRAGTYAEHLSIEKNLTLVGAGASRTIVDGHQSGTVVTVNAGATVAITGMTIQDGSGGGIDNSGTLTVTNSTVSGNTISGSGGGIANRSGQVTLTNSTVSGNSVSNGSGGGIFNSYGMVTLTNSTVSGNSGNSPPNGGGGGGITNSGTVTLINSTVSGNSVSGNSTATDSKGGGIYNSPGAVTLTNSTISGRGRDLAWSRPHPRMCGPSRTGPDARRTVPMRCPKRMQAWPRRCACSPRLRGRSARAVLIACGMAARRHERDLGATIAAMAL